MSFAESRMSPGATETVTALYAEHALGLVRLAVVLTGDRGAAEDIVQDAFLGLYRRWDKVPDMAAPLAYLRVSVVNGCRTALRKRSRFSARPGSADGDETDGVVPAGGLAESAEASVLLSEQQRAMAAALRTLPRRQREALVLRYYLELSVSETAQIMGVSPGTVKSATHRALAAAATILKEGR